MSQSSNKSCEYEQCGDVTSDVNVDTGDISEISEINTNEIIQFTSTSVTEASNTNATGRSERQYKVDEGILPKIKHILFIIVLHNCLSFILCFVFLTKHYYLFAGYTVFGVAAPVLIFCAISAKWDQNCKANSLNPFKLFVSIFIKFEKFKECKDSMTLFKDSDNNRGIYIKTIRCIDDLRYSAATNALVHGAGQCVVQSLILTQCCDEHTMPVQIAVEILSVVLILCFIFVNRNGFCDFRNDLGICRVSILTYFLIFMTMFLYVTDIFTDFAMTFKYYWDWHYTRGTVTLVSIIGPGIFVTLIQHYTEIRPFTADIKQIISMILNLNPLIGYWKSIQLLIKTRKAEVQQNKALQETSYTEYIKNSFNVAVSTFYVCFTESCSQLIIQISFLLTSINFSDLENEKFNILSPVISVLNVSVSLILSLRSERIKDNKEDPLPILGMVLQFFAYFPIASRILALSLLASVHPFYTFLCMFLHWLLDFIWRVYHDKDLLLVDYLASAGAAIRDIYAQPTRTVRIEIIFQNVFFAENIAAILVWSFSKYGRVTTIAAYLLVFAIVLPSFIGLICTYLYNKYKKERGERVFDSF